MSKPGARLTIEYPERYDELERVKPEVCCEYTVKDDFGEKTVYRHFHVTGSRESTGATGTPINQLREKW